MKKKFLLSPLLIVILIIILGVGAAGAAIFIGGGGGSLEEVNLQKGLVGWWKFNGNAKDSTANSNHGAVSGTTLTTDRKGRLNSAYSLNGSGGITVNNPLGQSATSEVWSVTAWVKLSSSGPNANQYMASGMNQGNFLNYSTSNKMLLYLNGGGNDYYMYGTRSLRDDTWHLVSYVFRNSDGFRKVYIDGVDDSSSGPNLTSTPSGLSATFVLGNSITGSIDDVRIYNRAISLAEIRALYQEYDPGVVISDLQKGLVGNWKFNGNAKDWTANSNHGTVTGAILTTDRKGQVNKAYSFNEGTDNIDMGGASGKVFDFGTGDFTLSAWFYLNSLPGAYKSILSKGDSGAAGYGLEISSGNRVTASIQGAGGTNQHVSGSIPSAQAWHHLVAVFSRADQIYVYLDGNLDTQSGYSAGNTNSVNNASYTFGVSNRSPGSWSFNGLIDDVKIYNRALNAGEVKDLYQEYDPGIVVSDLQKGLMGWWKFDGNAKDATANSNHGTVNGSTLTTDRKGEMNKAYNFGGASDYISIGNPASLGNITNAITVSYWVYLNAYPAANYTAMVRKGTGYASGGSWMAGLTTDGSGYFFVRKGDNSTYSYAEGAGGWSAIPLKRWTHMVHIFDGSRTYGATYENGVVNRERSDYAFSTINITSNNVEIGRDSYYLNGVIDDVRIWNRALSSTEVTALYESY